MIIIKDKKYDILSIHISTEANYIIKQLNPRVQSLNWPPSTRIEIRAKSHPNVFYFTYCRPGPLEKELDSLVNFIIANDIGDAFTFNGLTYKLVQCEVEVIQMEDVYEEASNMIP